jgi:hypothetical protein
VPTSMATPFWLFRTTPARSRASRAFKELIDFDPKHEYPGYEGMQVMKPKTKGIEMGKISNLITDMTIKGASDAELIRAVKHSMVVIDAEKHKLNYKQSYLDQGISALQKKYQSDTATGKPGACDDHFSTQVGDQGSRARAAQGVKGGHIDPLQESSFMRRPAPPYTKTGGE